MTERRRLAVLFGVALLFYASVLAVMAVTDFGESLVFGDDGAPLDIPPDVPFYADRADDILSGKIPYLDFYSESPPLIMYLFIPAALLGNDAVAYAVLFSAYSFLTAGLIYWVMRSREQNLAYRATALYLLNPITVAMSVVLVQDEAVVAFFYALPVMLLLLGRGGSAVLAATVGALTKVFSAVLIPLAMIYQDRRGRVRSLIALVGVTAAVSVPILIVAGEDFLKFPSYYLRQSGDEGLSQGVSIWRFLYEADVVVPGVLLQALFALGSLAMLWVVWKKGIDPVRGGILMMMPFMLFFPKITGEYYIIPLALICVVGMVDARPAFWVFVAALLATFCQLFNSYGDEASALPIDGLWLLAPLSMSLTCHLILVWLTYRMVQMPPQPLFEVPR